VASSRKESRISIPLVIVFMVAGAVLLIWYFMASRTRPETPPPAITAEAKGYVRNLKLSGVEMKATANYAGAAVVEITGHIENAGNRIIDRVELTCVFYDPYGQEVQRERVPIVRATMRPGEKKTFRLPFEGLPNTWNQALPQLVIASIQFAA